LWYDAPGDPTVMTNEGLPVGNGRLGALANGDPAHETIIWTDATLWTGDANLALDDDGQFSYETEHFGTFGQLARLALDVPAHTTAAITDFRRELDLSNGLVVVTYAYQGVRYRREIFASHPDDVLVVRLTQSGHGSWTGSLTLAGTRGEPVTAGTSAVSFTGTFDNGLRYAATATAVGDGTVAAHGDAVTFAHCREVTLVLSGGTSYVPDPTAAFNDPAHDPLRTATARATAAIRAGSSALLGSHLADYHALEQRLGIDLGHSTAAQRAMPTPDRLAARAQGVPDPELEAAYLCFARHLMISGSRDSLPINLQGLWLDRNDPPWMSDYHTDINLQMVYWLADRAGLSPCFDALADYCVSQLPGWTTSTAQLFQDERNGFRNTSGKVAGWTLAISTNPFGGDGWWWHPAGNAWICGSLFEHYEYTLDKAYLARIYPLLKGACEFWEARLISTDVTDPATSQVSTVLVDDHDWSPEQGPTDAIGITYAQELVWQLFGQFGQAAATLGRDRAYASTIAGLRQRLYLPRVSRTTGRLEEWMSDDDLGETTHRHLSPLIGLFPGDRINLQETPSALVDGARNLLIARGMESYGWGLAWRAACWARLKDPARCYELLEKVWRPSVDNANGSAINLFDMYQLSSTSSVFQIDANMGAPSAMVEMLVQSRPGRVEVLPALPDAWAASGSVRGVGARPGLTVDVAWAHGR
ncbi:MAG: glycoside hydrolase family 95 protein, partial [Nocardioides sp.]|nr:glycoside hydrolase family 95 protein [Nocardioides sp.]